MFPQALQDLNEKPNQSVNDSSYFECIESAMESQKKLADSIHGVTEHAQAGELEQFGFEVASTQKALADLAEAAAQVKMAFN